MIGKKGARRLAALTSGALMAGGLVAAPALAGLATASAAPVSLGYTCTVTGGGFTVPMDTTVTIDLTLPEAAAPGATVAADISTTIDMGTTAFGPVTDLVGTFDIPITVGDSTTTYTTDSASAPVTGLSYESSGSVDLTAPAAAGAAAVTVGEITGSLKAMPFGTDLSVPCVPDAGQDQTIGSLNVEGDGPVDPGTPDGILYHCTYADFPDTVYEAHIDLDLTDLPASTDQGSGYDPALDATVAFTDEASDGLRAIGLTVEEGSAHLHLSNAFAQGEGETEIILSETAVPAEGPATWTGSGNFGVLETSVPGTHDLTVGDGAVEMRASVVFVPGAVFPVNFDCAVAEGQDTVIGSLTVNESTTNPAVCADLEAKADKAATKVTKKQAAVKKAKTAKKNAKAKVKNAKSKNAKAKAKKQLKNSNAKLKKAKKQLKKAKKQFKKAEQAFLDACAMG